MMVLGIAADNAEPVRQFLAHTPVGGSAAWVGRLGSRARAADLLAVPGTAGRGRACTSRGIWLNPACSSTNPHCTIHTDAFVGRALCGPPCTDVIPTGAGTRKRRHGL